MAKFATANVAEASSILLRGSTIAGNAVASSVRLAPLTGD
jgi:hypothetical protein